MSNNHVISKVSRGEREICALCSSSPPKLMFTRQAGPRASAWCLAFPQHGSWSSNCNRQFTSSTLPSPPPRANRVVYSVQKRKALLNHLAPKSRCVKSYVAKWCQTNFQRVPLHTPLLPLNVDRVADSRSLWHIGSSPNWTMRKTCTLECLVFWLTESRVIKLALPSGVFTTDT